MRAAMDLSPLATRDNLTGLREDHEDGLVGVLMINDVICVLK